MAWPLGYQAWVTGRPVPRGTFEEDFNPGLSCLLGLDPSTHAMSFGIKSTSDFFMSLFTTFFFFPIALVATPLT